MSFEGEPACHFKRSDCVLLAINQGTNGGALMMLPAGILQTYLALGKMTIPEHQPPFPTKTRIARNLLARLLKNMPGIVQDGLVVESDEQS